MRLHIKTITISLIAIVFLSGCGIAKRSEEKKESQERYKIAKAMFDERCKKSGVFIHKTVKDVDGIFLMKLRPQRANFDNQYKLSDPYGKDLRGDNYISFLLKSHHKYLREGRIRDSTLINKSSSINEAKYNRGYLFVEAIDEKDGKLYRYTGESYSPWETDPSYARWVREYRLIKLELSNRTTRYGLTYDDISEKEDRDYWIAGSSLKIVDLQTNELIAERIGYMMDVGQGRRKGGRSPWLFAADLACPTFKKVASDRAIHSQLGQSMRFMEKVLVPNFNSRNGE